MTLLFASAVGVALYTWPFFVNSGPASWPLLMLCGATVLAIAILEIAMRRLDSRLLALLIAICTLDCALRAVVVTGIGGFSPIYFLIICAGYVFGPTYGFLCGGMTLLASGVITGGIGPWIPYEFFATAWVGMFAGFAGLPRRNKTKVSWADVAIMLVIGAVFGYLCGALADIFDWTSYWQGTPNLGWLPGAPMATNLGNFGRFYLTTSLAWDQLRAIGNIALILLLSRPVIAALRRADLRSHFVIEPA